MRSIHLIVSIRNPGEVEELKKTGDFVLIAVDAPVRKRYDRIQERHRVDDSVTFEHFKEIEERQNSDDPAHMHLKEVIAMADYYIDNSGDYDDLKENVLKLLEFLKKKAKEFHEKKII